MDIDIDCPNNECDEIFTVSLESEELAQDSEHESQCPHCSKIIEFTISYYPSVGCERVKEDQSRVG